MSTDVSASLSAARRRVTEDLLAEGFEEESVSDERVVLVREFEIPRPGGPGPITDLVSIEIRPDFPYRRPRVQLTGGGTGPSWHQEQDGALCLWAADNSVAHLPWKDASVLVERIELWLKNSVQDWPDDLPILDLERYLPVSRERFLIPDAQIDVCPNGFFEVQRRRDPVPHYIMGSYLKGPPMPRKRRHSAVTVGVAANLRSLERPFLSWLELRDLLDSDWVQRLEDLISREILRIVIVQYTRGGYEGAAVLHVGPDDAGQHKIVGAMQAVPTSQVVRMLRGGSTADDLANKRVAVVGIGAVGSNVVDLLVRRGVGHLTLVDGKDMRPGNAVRHLIGGQGSELLKKVDAVKSHIDEYGFVPEDTVTSVGQSVTTVKDATELVENHDLIIDATAAGECAALFADLSSQSGTPVLQVALQRDGGVIRIDRYPEESGEPRHREIPDTDDESGVVLEPGCTDPVSPTTPDTVVEAAVWTVRLAVDQLLGRNEYGPTLLAVTTPQPDAPLNEIGVVAS